jgi:hypothetical protein
MTENIDADVFLFIPGSVIPVDGVIRSRHENI